MNDRPAFDLDTVLPAWEACYEPGNVSDYLIGYANDEAAAKGAALAWLTSQSDKDPATLEWIDVPHGNGYDHWFNLIQNAEDGMALDIGINVRRRLPATVRDAARTASGQQPETTPCACTHPQDRHLSACTECPCIGYAPTWPPTKRRIVPVCDQCGAPWATSHRCATAPAVGQPAEAQATDVCSPRIRWAVEHRFLAGTIIDPPIGISDRAEAEAHLEATRARWPEATHRLVRETTTWTVEDER
ncbi:hypothetical protein [Streptomyces sp. NPDC058667]|uniref:hypothetical protein n=1 Tax=Streptomyces sp. NPDC058667 TaxID=3346588 RepID=UPI0036620DD0